MTETPDDLNHDLEPGLPGERLRGRVIRSQSGFFTVETPLGPFVCQLRGRLKRGPRRGDMAAIGDWVQLTPIDDFTGMIEIVEPRTSAFARHSPNPQEEYQQILIANPDQIAIVLAAAHPAPRLGMLDRFLVIAEHQGLPARVVINKIDLVGEDQSQDLFAPYVSLGYDPIFVSALMGQGIDRLREHFTGKVTLLTGPSGVGKTSLLNAVQPGLGLQVREVSQATGKGRHTTVVRQLFPLDGGGYVADTPGIKALALYDIEPEELDAYFPEIRRRVSDCDFSDCTHVHEPGCAVLQGVAEGEIHPLRYQSYLRMRYGDDESY